MAFEFAGLLLRFLYPLDAEGQPTYQNGAPPQDPDVAPAAHGLAGQVLEVLNARLRQAGGQKKSDQVRYVLRLPTLVYVYLYTRMGTDTPYVHRPLTHRAPARWWR